VCHSAGDHGGSSLEGCGSEPEAALPRSGAKESANKSSATNPLAEPCLICGKWIADPKAARYRARGSG